MRVRHKVVDGTHARTEVPATHAVPEKVACSDETSWRRASFGIASGAAPAVDDDAAPAGARLAGMESTWSGRDRSSTGAGSALRSSTTVRASVTHASPELLEGRPVTETTDVYSMASIVPPHSQSSSASVGK